MSLLKTFGAMLGTYKPQTYEKSVSFPQPAAPTLWQSFLHVIYSTQPSQATETDLQFYRKTQNSVLERNVKTQVDSVHAYLDTNALKPEGNGQRSFGEVYFDICKYLWEMYSTKVREPLNNVVLTLVLKTLRGQCFEDRFDACIAALWQNNRLAALKKVGKPVTTCGSDMSVHFQRMMDYKNAVHCSAPKTSFNGHVANDPRFATAWPYFFNGDDIVTHEVVADYIDESADASSLLFAGGRKKRSKSKQKPLTRRKNKA